MIGGEPWDVTNQPDRTNIERIVRYLGQVRVGSVGVVPGAALDALLGLLARAEIAERSLEELRAEKRRLSAPSTTGARQVIEEFSYVCRVCGETVVTTHVMGAFRPSVCGRERCRREARQEDARERQRRFRERSTAGKEGRTTLKKE